MKRHGASKKKSEHAGMFLKAKTHNRGNFPPLTLGLFELSFCIRKAILHMKKVFITFEEEKLHVGYICHES